MILRFDSLKRRAGKLKEAYAATQEAGDRPLRQFAIWIGQDELPEDYDEHRDCVVWLSRKIEDVAEWERQAKAAFPLYD
jgi:hypothetical protein